MNDNFQTPLIVCDYMASLVPKRKNLSILEPTPGKGNLVSALRKKGNVTAPKRFESVIGKEFDIIVMNPPFTPMERGYYFLSECMKMSNHVIALLPWFILINSDRRLNEIKSYGLKAVTHLPRKTFPGCRIQTCVLEMKQGWTGPTDLKYFTW